MNIALFEINSYTRSIKILINGVQPSIYGELSNFTYEDMLKAPKTVLAAVAQETNDDYELQVIANPYEFSLIEKATKGDEYCTSCRLIPAKISLSTRERAERLGDIIPARHFNVLLEKTVDIPENTAYGNIILSFSADKTANLDLVLDGSSEELVLSACETYLVNPCIGKAVANLGLCSNEVAICARLNPILSVSMPNNAESGNNIEIAVSAYPNGCEVPDITVKTSNPDVLSANGKVLTAHNSGVATVQVFVSGENRPFYTQTVSVSQTIYVSKIDFVDFPYTLISGNVVDFDYTVYPNNATSEDVIYLESSDHSVARPFKHNSLALMGYGKCTITAHTKYASCSKEINVRPQMTSLLISQNEFNLNIGQKAPVNVKIDPADAYIGSTHTWHSSDESVAVVVKEGNTEYVKSVGIGTCELIYTLDETGLQTRCDVTVKSAMYNNGKKSVSKFWLVLALVAVLAIVLKIAGIDKLFTEKQDDEPDYSSYENVEMIDIFADVEISFSGENGTGTVNIVNNSQNPFVCSCYFYTRPSQDLSNGSEITVSAYFEESVIELYGYAPITTTKTVVVTGLSTRIENYKQVPKEFIDEAVEYHIERINTQNNEMAAMTHTVYTDVEYYGAFFQDAKYSDDTILVLIFGYTTNGTIDFDSFIPIEFYDIGVDENGKVTADVSVYGGGNMYSYSNYTDLVNSLFAKENYVTVQVE